MKKIISIFLISLMLVACAKPTDDIIDEPVVDEPVNETTSNEEEYEKQINMAKYISIGYNEFNDLLDKENDFTGVLLMSKANCPWCQRLIPVLTKYLNAEQKSIFYLDTNAAKSEDTYDETIGFNKVVEKCKDQLLEVGSVDENNEPALYVPLLIAFKNGLPIKAHLSVLDEYRDVTQELTLVQEATLYQEICELFETLQKTGE